MILIDAIKIYKVGKTRRKFLATWLNDVMQTSEIAKKRYREKNEI